MNRISRVIIGTGLPVALLQVLGVDRVLAPWMKGGYAIIYRSVFGFLIVCALLGVFWRFSENFSGKLASIWLRVAGIGALLGLLSGGLAAVAAAWVSREDGLGSLVYTYSRHGVWVGFFLPAVATGGWIIGALSALGGLFAGRICGPNGAGLGPGQSERVSKGL
jgi:hypothetical protein